MAQILSVFAWRMTRRTLEVSLCFNSLTVPVPRSFHWFPSLSNRYSLALLRNRTRGSDQNIAKSDRIEPKRNQSVRSVAEDSHVE